MSLAYLLSILFLYSCVYTLHIPYSFYNLLFFMFYYIFFHILLYFYILSILFMCSSFMVIYYTILLYSIFMYCVHILFSCYTFHITFSFMYCTCSYTFRVIDTLLFVLVYLSSHSSAMLLISCHIFSTFHLQILVIFFYVSCLHKP